MKPSDQWAQVSISQRLDRHPPRRRQTINVATICAEALLHPGPQGLRAQLVGRVN